MQMLKLTGVGPLGASVTCSTLAMTPTATATGELGVILATVVAATSCEMLASAATMPGLPVTAKSSSAACASPGSVMPAAATIAVAALTLHAGRSESVSGSAGALTGNSGESN